MALFKVGYYLYIHSYFIVTSRKDLKFLREKSQQTHDSGCNIRFAIGTLYIDYLQRSRMQSLWVVEPGIAILLNSGHLPRDLT